MKNLLFLMVPLFFYSCNKREVIINKKEGYIIEYQVVKSKKGDYVKDGYYKSYYDNNQKMSEGVFDMGSFSGEWSRWHRNGVLESKGTYINNTKEGYWDIRDDKKRLIRKAFYKNGKDTVLLGDWQLQIEDYFYIFSFTDTSFWHSDLEKQLNYKERENYLYIDNSKEPTYYIRKNVNDSLILGFCRNSINKTEVHSNIRLTRIYK